MKLKDILKLKKEDLQEKAKLILDTLEPINDLYALSLESLCNIYSSSIDKKITSYQKDNNSEYISGEFIVNLQGENKFLLFSDLYFKNENGKFHKLSLKSETFDINKLNKESQSELLNSKMIKFDINL